MNRDVSPLVQRLARWALRANVRIVTAESCTGGWLAKVFTDEPGSSRWFECGYVTYSDRAKVRDLGVARRTLTEHGAVSEATVREMAAGALRVSAAEMAIAVSGIAGPEGGSTEKPVGTVWFCIARATEGEPELLTEGRLFAGTRETIRWLCIEQALQLALRWEGEQGSAG